MNHFLIATIFFFLGAIISWLFRSFFLDKKESHLAIKNKVLRNNMDRLYQLVLEAKRKNERNS